MATDRRALLTTGLLGAAGLALPAGAGARGAPSELADADASKPASQVTGTLARWARTLRFEHLPSTTIHEAKRYLLDSLGCAIAGWNSDKGRTAAAVMEAISARGPAQLLGTARGLQPAQAAFANAELMNGLDFDAIPHTPPVTLPAILAIAQHAGKTGRDLLVATVIGHELAARLSASSSQMQQSLNTTGTTPEVFGINTEAIIAAAAAGATLLSGDEASVLHAMGLGAYYAPPQVSHDWETLRSKTNVKYTPVGAISQGAVSAAFLAAAGYTSHPHVLDGPAAFPRFYGWAHWDPAKAVAGLGREWRIDAVDYKPYAACRFVHSQIDCMRRIRQKHAFDPHEIAGIETLGVPFVAHPDPMNVTTQEDAQFSTPYNVALAACGIPIDATAQSPQRLADPVVRSVMEKIRWGVHPGTAAARTKDPRSYAARVTLRLLDGREWTEEAIYARGTASQPDMRLSDDELNAKFLDNSTVARGGVDPGRLADRIWSLENFSSVRELFD